MKISNEFDTIVGFAREEAMRTGSYSIEADHLFLGILRHRSNDAVAYMQSHGVDTDDCKRVIDSYIFHEHSIPFSEEENIKLGRFGSSTVNMAIAEAMAEGAVEAGAMHLLKAICKAESCHARAYLGSRGAIPAGNAGGKASRKKTADNSPSAEELGKLLSTIRINTTIVS